jgi:hypothetical protein
MGKLADKLSERSRLDDSIIVGSEIRAALQELCDEAQRWHERYRAASVDAGNFGKICLTCGHTKPHELTPDEPENIRKWFDGDE